MVKFDPKLTIDDIDIIVRRDKLLAASDWMMTFDSPLTDEEKAAWAAYRQELRDLPQQEGYPDVLLPTPPSSGE